jgi:D-3-phosphoglycerate dehydrogenase / 2-oxoglutarate reductase
MQKKALITAEIDPLTVNQLEERGYTVTLAGWGQSHIVLSEQELIALMPGTHLLVVEVEKVPASVIEASSELEVIHVCRSAPSTVDLTRANERGIAVLSTPGRNADSVADFTMAVLLNVARGISRSERHLRNHGWMVEGEIPYFHFRGPELAGKTLGMIGCGAIGRALLQRLSGFNLNVLIYDPYLSVDVAVALGQLAMLEEVLQQSDFLSIHCAVTPQTTGMIAEKEFALMKPSAFLINTARAVVTDEDALYQALKDGKIGGAALDVFWDEPLPSGSRWLELENVLLTPHLGGASDDVRIHHGQMLIDDLGELAEGRIPHRLANPEILEQD